MNLNHSLLIKNLTDISTIFEDPAGLQRHLSVMKYNPGLEWFNIALIALDRNAAKRGFRLVLSEEDWQKYGISYPLTGKGIPLLFPSVDRQQLSWQIRRMYTVGDFGLDEPANEAAIASIFGAYESSGKIALVNQTLPEGWQSRLIERYLSTRAVPESMSRSFLKACLTAAWGPNMYMETKVTETDLAVDIPDRERWKVYQCLSNTITEFPRYFMLWIENQPVNPQRSDLAAITLQLMKGVSR